MGAVPDISHLTGMRDGSNGGQSSTPHGHASRRRSQSPASEQFDRDVDAQIGGRLTEPGDHNGGGAGGAGDDIKSYD